MSLKKTEPLCKDENPYGDKCTLPLGHAGWYHKGQGGTTWAAIPLDIPRRLVRKLGHQS